MCACANVCSVHCADGAARAEGGFGGVGSTVFVCLSQLSRLIKTAKLKEKFKLCRSVIQILRASECESPIYHCEKGCVWFCLFVDSSTFT